MRQVLPSCLLGTVTQLLSSQVSLPDDYGFEIHELTTTANMPGQLQLQ